MKTDNSVKTNSKRFISQTVCFFKSQMFMLPRICQSLLLGCLLLSSTAGSADSKAAPKGTGNAAVPPAGSALSAAKAGVDEAALAAQRRAEEAAALSNIELRSQTKAGVDEAAVAARRRAGEAATLSNVELRDQTKAGVDEAASAAQLRAGEAAARFNVEMRSPAKAATDEAALAAQLSAAEAAVRSNVELRDQTKAGVDEAAVAAQLRATEAAALSNVEMRSQAKAAADEAGLAAAQRARDAAVATAGPQPLAVADAAPGVVRVGPAVKPPEGGTRQVTRAVPFGPSFVSTTYQQNVKLPPLSAAQLSDLQKPDSTPEKGSFQVSAGRVFDQPLVVNDTTAPATAWTLLPNGWRVWLMDVGSAGALGLRVHLESVHLPDGVRVVAYDPANPAPEATAITAQSLFGETEVWTESIFSDRVVVECQVPPGVDLATVGFRATGLTHFFRSLFPKPETTGAKAAEGCENDVTCYPAWAGEASGVARIHFIKGGNGYLCTGCLLNTSPSTFIDYFLTANHCVGDQTTASTLEAYWFYQTSTCNGTPPSLGSVPHTTGGADLLATQTRAAGNDFSFMRLRSPAPGGTEYAGWTTGSPSGADTLTSIHHPAGDYKRISFGNTTGNDANWWDMRWYNGVTEHGSSGCPLYNTGHQVIGQLYGGLSDCTDQAGIDQYGRFNVTYNAINYWLFPPANDVCSGAVALSDSSSYYSEWTTNATDDTGLTCSSAGTIFKGVWFAYVPTLTGTATVDTCSSTFDTKIEVFSGACGGLTSLGCNDDSPACGTGSAQSSLSFACTAGQTYYICAGGYGGASGHLQIRAKSVCASSDVPANDVCSGAYTLSDGPFYFSESTICASDDTVACLGTAFKGVWFTYTPTVTGTSTVDTCTSDFDTKIVVFSGTCGALTAIGCNDDSCGLQSSFSFACTAGTTYRICAGGFGGASGNLKIRAQAYCTSGTLQNDTCSTAYYLMDSLNYTTEYTACATDDANMPCSTSHTIYKGVWFYYTPTVTGTSVVETCGSDFDTKIEIFSGTCAALTSLGCNDDSCSLQSRFSFPCAAGTTYRICAGGYAGNSGNLKIRAYSLCNGGPPGNDTCTNAYSLYDSQVYTSEYTACAMDDTNLPCTGQNTIYRGVWYSFNATATGTATVDACGSDFDTKIVVFSGACGALTALGCNDDFCGLQSSVSFPCVAGTNYLICAGGWGGQGGNLKIRSYSVCSSGPPANDTCGGATYLPDSQGYTALNTACAMDDINLPCIGTMYRGVWFTYTPTVSGTAVVDTCTSDFDTKLAVYSGACGALTSLGCNDDSCDLQSRVSFACTAGTTYHVCAGGFGGESGNLKIRAYSVCTGVPVNDLCGGAVALAENVYYPQHTGCATDDSGLPCLGIDYHGVWFTYTPPVSGWAIVDTCPSDFDTKIEVFSGVCGALTSLGCNDDSDCGFGPSLQSSVGFSCVAGTTYRICAGGWGGAFGNLQIRARTTLPPNDTCAGAFVLSDGAYYAENTGTALDDASMPCSISNRISKGVWFAYTAARTGSLTVDTCPSGFDTKIEVFRGACGALSSLGCNDDSCGFQSKVAVPVSCGATYYICAGGYDGSAWGNLQIRAALTPARPPLAITTAGTNVVISWPTAYPCFALYSVTNLPAAPADWLSVAPSPTIVGGNYTVTNAIGAVRRFYRLQ